MKNLVLLILMLISFSFASTSLNVGIYENAPLSYINTQTKEKEGLFIDILKNIAKKENLNLNFIPCKFQHCLKLLKNKKIDILGPIAYSDKRAKEILFLDVSILSNWGVVYTKKNTYIKNFLDLRNKKIGALKQDIYVNFFLEHTREFKVNTKIVLFNTYNDIFKAIEDKQIFAGIGGKLLYYGVYKKFPNIKASSIIFKPVNLTFALNKQDVKLKKLLDTDLKKYKIDENSKYYEILNQYLTIKTNRPYLKWIILTFIVLFLLVISLLYINKLLKYKINKATRKLFDAKNIIKKNLSNQIYLTNIITTVKDVNQLLLEKTTKREKFKDICDKISENEIYSFCLVAHIDATGTVSVVAKSRHDIAHQIEDILQGIKIEENPIFSKVYKSKNSHMRKITGRILYVCKENCEFSYSLSVPIFVDAKLTHIICVLTTNPNGFKDKEIELINELSGDIGLWLTLEKHKKDKEASYKQIVLSLNKTVEARDPYTAGHDERVQKYTQEIAKAMHLSTKEEITLEKAALIHDIGKIKIPDSILLKPGKLTSVEYEIIKEHPQAAYDMLSDVIFLQDEMDVILHHHERYDGSGYPQGLKKDEIPILSQILSIADTYDAMTTNRIYKQAKSKEEALRELDSLRDISFSSNLIDIAIKIFSGLPLNQKIHQTPIGELEEARFSYFFRDNLTTCYNKNFLQFIYLENHFSKYQFLYTINLKKFTAYNNLFGWENGDKFLTDFSNFLRDIFHTKKIFRIKGDDFFILSKKKSKVKKDDILKNRLFNEQIISIDLQQIKISQIKNIDDLKNIIRLI